MIKTRFYVGGCSGSSSPIPARREFGNLTTALGISCGNQALFVDNGSGIPKVSKFLLDNGAESVCGLQTHYHQDHKLGIQNNSLLFRKNLVHEIFAPKLCKKSFQQIMLDDFGTETWPVSPEMFGCIADVREFYPGQALGTVWNIRTLLLDHPGGSVMYRIATPDGDVVVATDNEPKEEHMGLMAEFISGCQLLYFDLQYRKSEYEGETGICGTPAMSRKNWGHGTPEMLGGLLSRCQILPSLIMVGHHDPSRTDGDLFVFEHEVIKPLSNYPSKISFAREGEAVEL